ncbi:ran-binding protein 6 [Artemisia annua]|uniref:Ran-binding protein 6 n=1 Tax=Artemisia annua TaxID=35608 RepID=A0A2U1NE03_ARTAN|nr:ran-binding protein 6 [Artemisia annua]
MDPVEKWLESQLQVAESEMSHTAIEHLTYVAAELYLAGIITDRKYPPRFHSRLFAVLMRMLSDINDYYEEGDSFRFGKECLVRLAKHLGGVIIFPVAYDQFSEYLAAPDTEWRKHHAALVMIRNSQQLVTMVLNSFRHPHPRVRSAALTAIVRLSHDLNLQPRYYTRMLPALASAMDDFEYPKLQSSNTWVQEAALTALASVADNSSQGQFQKYHDEVMPYLKAILVSKNDKASLMLRVSAKRCIDHFAVGKDKFRDAPKQGEVAKTALTPKLNFAEHLEFLFGRPTPNLDELKALTESGKLVDAFKLLIIHDKAEEESFIARMGEESSQLRLVIEKKHETIDEAAYSFTRFNVVAATGEDALREIQLKDRRKLDLLSQLLVLCRESLEEKKEFLEKLDDAAASDDEE